MALWLKFSAVLTALLVLTAGQKTYEGYQVLRITPSGETEDVQHLGLMQFLAKSKLDVWRAPRLPGGSADVMVSSLEASKLRHTLRQLGFNASVMIPDVDELIARENGSQTRQDDQLDSSNFHWVGYHSLEKIHKWLREKAQVYSGIASIISAGKSVEGREILGIRIAHQENLPIVMIEAGIHAREWIGVATATWFVRQVLSTDDNLLKSYEWHIFPSVNPDGYAFTREVRLWRKNRRAPSTAHPNSCYGVDLNRNWPFQWVQNEDECSDIYPGHAPSSEPETQGLVKYLDSVAYRTRVYISLHSYSQLLMYPWAYTQYPADNNQRLAEIAKKAADRLEAVYGTKYTTGPIATTIYPAFGSTLDYAYNAGIKYPFVFELRDTGVYGFLIPKELIIPTAQETLESLKVILEETKKN